MFCNISNSNKLNTAVLELNQLQETLLSSLQASKSDAQRQVLFKNCFQELQKFSQTFNDPLAELYAYHLYSNEQSYGRSFYLKDLKHNSYYNDLLERISTVYPESKYAAQLESDLNKDKYTLLEQKDSSNSYIIYLIGGLLLLSIVINIVLFRRRSTPTKEAIIDYKTILTPQEQNVFELMQQKHSNKQISESLFISVSTVKTHINNIYSKLNITSRKEIDAFFE